MRNGDRVADTFYLFICVFGLVDADGLSLGVSQSAAAVAGVDGRICLDVGRCLFCGNSAGNEGIAVIGIRRGKGTVCGADNAGCNGLTIAECVADGNNLFNAFSVDSAPRIFTVYSVYDEVTTILLFFLLCEILQHSDAEWDNMVLQQMMRQQRQQMELSKETVELINIKCHDIRKQLYTLGSRVPTEELDELKKAVDIYDSTIKTGNETLDVLLAERSIVCKGRGIQLDYIADGAKLDFLKPGEVYSLFGNALDNAIEAVTPLEPDRRYIGLQVRAERGMLLIRMENCAAEPLHFVDGLPQTTKGDARWHGFGVKSIRRIVQQHGGTLTMQAQDGMFRLVALLPLK